MSKLSFLATILAIAFHISKSLAATPKVKVIPLSPGTCHSYPFNQGRIPRTAENQYKDFSQYLNIEISGASNDALNGLSMVPKEVYTIASDTSKIYVADTRKIHEIARKQDPFGCENGKLTYDKGPSINVDASGWMSEGAGGVVPELYAHEIDGVRQEGVFLGVGNQTTWGLNWHWPSGCRELDYYQVSLIQNGTEYRSHTGFLRVVG